MKELASSLTLLLPLLTACQLTPPKPRVEFDIPVAPGAAVSVSRLPADPDFTNYSVDDKSFFVAIETLSYVVHKDSERKDILEHWLEREGFYDLPVTKTETGSETIRCRFTNVDVHPMVGVDLEFKPLDPKEGETKLVSRLLVGTRYLIFIEVDSRRKGVSNDDLHAFLDSLRIRES